MMRRSSWSLAVLTVVLASCAPPDPMEDPDIAANCDRPPFRTNDQRAAAMERGHEINRRHDCIQRGTYARTEARYSSADGAAARRERARREQEAEASAAAASRPRLRDARAQFHTRVGQPASGMPPLPAPPAALFVRSDYESAVGKLPAWVTPDPRDGEKHAAIVWITGGDSSSLDDFWTDGGPANDQSASAFREAGVIMMFPTLRGGNSNPGNKELFYGEVDDVIAAGEHLARLPYVDRVYLGGHSTGGTLALLVAESTDRFAGVFAFGPVAEISAYPPDIVTVDFAKLPADEQRLRSPIHWLESIASPTYLIEGSEAPGNAASLASLCAQTRNPFVHCISIPGHDHFSVLDAAGKKLAARISVGLGGDKPLLRAEEFSK